MIIDDVYLIGLFKLNKPIKLIPYIKLEINNIKQRL